jgi:perosamine synthetase
MNEKIVYTKPSVGELEAHYANDAVRNGWGAKCYEYIEKFEDSFKDYLGVEYAIATSSATGALHMGMAGLNIGKGDEVILADTNWVASIAPIIHLGATPVLVDIEESSWCLSVSEVIKAITPNTKAVLAVHLYGNVCAMGELKTVCDPKGIYVIEDAAEAIGSEYNGLRAGSMGVFGAFSFHGTKTITTGEGGMFVTRNKRLYDKVLTLSNHGRSKSQQKQFWPDMLGFKYKMSNIQAAIGLAQIQRVEELVNRKKEIFSIYETEINKLDGVSLNQPVIGRDSGYWMVNVVFESYLEVNREMLLDYFSAENIDARVFFWPLSSLDFVCKRHKTPVAYDLSNRSINLPSFHDITNEEQMRVVEVIKRVLKDRL